MVRSGFGRGRYLFGPLARNDDDAVGVSDDDVAGQDRDTTEGDGRRDPELTSSLYSRLGFERVLVERVVGAASLGYELPQGRRLPLTVGAGGKILIAALDEDRLAEVISASVGLRYEPEDITLEDLRRRLPAPGEDYAYSEDERATGVVSIAVAVPARTGTATESIALTAPVHASSRDDLIARVPELRHAARRLAELLASTVY